MENRKTMFSGCLPGKGVKKKKIKKKIFLWQCEETIFAKNVLIMNYKDLLHNHFKSPNCSTSLKAATGCLLWSAVSAQCPPWVTSVVAERHEPVTAAHLWPSLIESLLGTVAGLGFGIRQADSFGKQEEDHSNRRVMLTAPTVCGCRHRTQK